MKITNKAFSVIEYSIFIILIITALYVSKDFISRAIMGHWQAAGDTFAFGRQYDATHTMECSYDGESNKWYEQGCFDQRRAARPVCDIACEREIIVNQCSFAACQEF